MCKQPRYGQQQMMTMFILAVATIALGADCQADSDVDAGTPYDRASS